MSALRPRRREALAVAVLPLLFAALRRLGKARALALGAALGRAWYRGGGQRAQTALVNLRIAFPGWSEFRRRSVAEASFANLGRGLAELAFLPRLTPENVREVVALDGLEHLEAAQRASPCGGVIALTAHLGNWELFAAAVGLLGIPLTVVYRERSPLLEGLVRGWRERGATLTVPRGSAARATLRALREGRVVAMPLDQDSPEHEGVFAPFFTRLACTRDGPARIALRTGAPVLPVFLLRRGTSGRHLFRIRPALQLDPAGADASHAVLANVRRMNAALEEAIREAPEQWTWTHRRWRTVPPGEPRPYVPLHRRAYRLPDRLPPAAASPSVLPGK
jgi:KDO2-lipid IV(A) lauroyltransferase